MLLRYSSESNCYGNFLLICPNNAHEELFGDFILISLGVSPKCNSRCDTSLVVESQNDDHLREIIRRVKDIPSCFIVLTMTLFTVYDVTEVASIGFPIRVALIC